MLKVWEEFNPPSTLSQDVSNRGKSMQAQCERVKNDVAQVGIDVRDCGKTWPVLKTAISCQ